MFSYEELKTQPRKFLSQTSLTVAEFEDLLPAFEKAFLKKYPVKKTKAGKVRKRKAGAGRKSSLGRIEQKLLFALVYGSHARTGILVNRTSLKTLQYSFRYSVQRLSGLDKQMPLKGDLSRAWVGC